MAELGVGYLSIVPEVSKIKPGIATALKGAEPAGDASGKSMGNKIATGIGGVLKSAAVGVGVASGAALGAGLAKGLGRLNGIEQAEAKLRGLGHSTETVAGIMNNALGSVRGTAFGLEEAGTVAAQVVAAGIKPGQELEQVLKTVADTATIAGASMDEMGTIFGSVAARGKLQGDDMLQLMSRGVPVLQLLADQLGVTSAEVSDMVTKGQVDFATFEQAMRKGMGGAALESGNTVIGSLRNVGAAVGRLGATLAGPFYRQAAGAFSGVTSALDSMNDAAGPVMQRFEGWLTSEAMPALREFGQQAVTTGADAIMFGQRLAGAVTAGGGLSTMLGEVWETASRLGPVITQFGSALGTASAQLGVSTWQIFLTTLTATAQVANATLVPALEAVANFAESNQLAVTGLVAAWMAFKTVPGILSHVTSSLEGVRTAGKGIDDLRAYAKAGGEEMGRLEAAVHYMGTSSNTVLQATGQAASQGSAGLLQIASSHKEAASAAAANALSSKDAFTSIDFMAQQAGHNFVATTARMGAAAKGAAAGGFAALKQSATNLVNALGGPMIAGLTAATVFIGQEKAAAAEAAAAHDRMTEAVREGAAAQSELQAVVAGTTGALSEQGLALAAKVAGGELAKLTEEGSRSLGMTERLGQATASFDQVIGKIPGVLNDAGRAAADNNASNKELRDSYNALKDAADTVGVPMSALNDVVAEGGADYQRLIQNLRGSGDAGNAAADQLEGARDKIEQMVAAARRVDPEFAAARAGMEQLGDAAGNADDKLSALERTMQALGLAPKDAERAMMEAAEATGELAEQAASAIDPALGLGSAMLDASGALDPMNANAREFSTAMEGMRAELQNVAVNGGDVNQAFRNMGGDLEALQAQFGWTDAEMQQWIDHFGLVPDKISTLVELEGVDDSIEDIINVAAQLDGIPEGQTVEVGALTDDAVAKLKELGWDVEELEDGNVVVTASTEEAQQKLDDFGWRAADLNNLDITPELYLDTTPLEGSATHAQGLIDLLDIQNPTPQAGMIIDDLLAGQDISMGELAILASQTPTPIADLEKYLLENGVRLSKDQLTSLHNQLTKPKIDANGKPLSDEVDRAKRKMDEVKDKTVTIRVNTHYSTSGAYAANQGMYSSGRMTSSGGTTVGQHYASGGTIQDLTAGGQLPATGPGTDRTDGFIGLNANGDPFVRVDAEEEVIRASSAKKHRRLLKAINADDPRIADLPAFNTGGTIAGRAGLDRALEEFRSSVSAGARYLYGGHSREAADCSGFVGRGAWAAQGHDPDASGRMGNTTSLMAGQWPGFSRGINGPFVIGVNSEHMAATVDDIPVESGGDVGGPSVGKGDGAFDPQFKEHWSMDWSAFSPPYSDAVPEPETTEETATSATSASTAPSTSAPSAQREPQKWSEWVGEQVGEGAKQWIKGTSSAYIADTIDVFGLADEMPSYAKAGFELKSAVEERDRLAKEEAEREAAASSTATTPAPPTPAAGQEGDVGVTYDPSKGAEQWRPVVVQALQRVGGSEGNTSITVEQIDIESGGDPNAQNDWDINAKNGDPSVGLLQVIGSTFAAHRDPELPDDRTHPLANITAALRYVDSEYGGPASIWPTRAGYASGGQVRRGKHGGRGPRDDIQAWLEENEYVVKADSAEGNEEFLDAFNASGDVGDALAAAAPDVARDAAYAGSHAALLAGVGAASSGLTMAGSMVPGLAPLASVGGSVISSVGGQVADTGARIVSEVVGQAAEAGVRMTKAGEETIRANLPRFTAAVPGGEYIDQANQAAQQVQRRGPGMEQHVHYHVMDLDEAMRKQRAREAQYAQTLAGVG